MRFDGKANSMDAWFIRVLPLPKDGIFGTSFSEKPSLPQGCHINVEVGKFLEDEGCVSLWTNNVNLVLESVDIPDPKAKR